MHRFWIIWILSCVTVLMRVHSKVAVSLQYAWTSSMKEDPIISKSDNLTYLKSSDSDSTYMHLKCSANYPVEWVFYEDDTVHANTLTIRRSHEWSERQLVDQNIDEAQAVLDHDDNILVKLTPFDNGANSLLVISLHPNAKPAGGEEDEDKQIATDSSTKCNVNLKVIQLKTGVFWRCETEKGSEGQIKVRRCGSSSAYCANTLRRAKKRDACLVRMNATTSIDATNWRRFDDDVPTPGIAICTPNNVEGAGSQSQEQIAVEFFYSGLINSGHENDEPHRRLHMIWMDPPVAFRNYTNEPPLNTNCVIPMYGFAIDPILRIKLNGSTIILDRDYDDSRNDWTWCKKVELQFSRYGPGNYEVQCIAAVWNSTEWANKTYSITVRDPIAPYFELAVENITYKDDDSNKLLVCDARGDPEPIITWDQQLAIPATRIEGSTLRFVKVSKHFADQASIACTATNKFGQAATKSFLIHVNTNKPNDDDRFNAATTSPLSSSSSFPTIGIVIIVVVVFILLLLIVGGMLFLYFRFLKVGSAMTTSLTCDEVKVFREGKGKIKLGRARPDEPGGESPFLVVESLPYNAQFEVAKDNLIVDFNHELGSGEYGIVYHGHVRRQSSRDNSQSQSPKRVAIKTVRRNVHINYFKALLSELKILAYIGHHENVVNLIGACTRNIKNRELYVGVELCKTSLLKFLQANRNGFQNVAEPRYLDVRVAETSFTNYQTSCKPKTMTTYDLIKWSADVASGMEFLSRKKVVHGDLAARNILLSYDLNCKICDFGLARQLINYSYMKMQQCALPWKWMAIESSRDMKFSIKSDVWAYGVTLWEIFSLGQVPYPGMAWNMDFVEQLNTGLRMTKPAFSSPEIFKMMFECWRQDPRERPIFAELKQCFQALEAK